jgi:hypothetical protein
LEQHANYVNDPITKKMTDGEFKTLVSYGFIADYDETDIDDVRKIIRNNENNYKLKEI